MIAMDPMLHAITVLDTTLENVDFTHPVALEDVTAVHNTIRSIIPAEVRLESYHHIRDVVFELRVGDVLKAQRIKKVIDP
jgi:hypothetical protein